MADTEDSFNSVSVQLLTLLNVSATKRPATNGKKRGRLDGAGQAGEAEEKESKRRKLGGKRKVVFADGEEQQGKVNGAAKEKVAVDIDAANDDDEPEGALLLPTSCSRAYALFVPLSGTDGEAFVDHFGIATPLLSSSAVAAVEGGKWTTREKRIGALGNFREYVPDGTEASKEAKPARVSSVSW